MLRYSHELCPIVLELQKRPQPVQKSEAWYSARKGALTASDVAAALPRDECSLREYLTEYGKWLTTTFKFSSRSSMNPYETTNNLLLKKIGLGKPFVGNAATDFGNMFEHVAQLVYEKLHQVDLLEFGLLFDPDNPWIGASPDGIRADGKALVEIKCPLVREVGNPPPHYYWTQMLWQMIVTKINKTHFMDCKFQIYVSKRTWLDEYSNDINRECFAIDVHHEQSKKYMDDFPSSGVLRYGAIIEKSTFDNMTNTVVDISYIYPPEIFGTIEEIENWCNTIIEEYLHNPTDTVRVIYYKLNQVFIFTAIMEDNWFSRNKPRLEKFWNSVLSKRKDMETKPMVIVDDTLIIEDTLTSV